MAPVRQALEPSFPLVTDRLLLRPFVKTDLEPLLAIQSGPTVTSSSNA